MAYSTCIPASPYATNDYGLISKLISDLHFTQEQLFIAQRAAERELEMKEKLKKDLRRITMIDDQERNFLKISLNKCRSDRDQSERRLAELQKTLESKTAKMGMTRDVIAAQQAVILGSRSKPSAPLILDRDDTVRALTERICVLQSELRSEKESKHRLLHIVVGQEAMLSNIRCKTQAAAKMLSIAMFQNDLRSSFIFVCRKLFGELFEIFKRYR